tara:strand:+ start:1188 stop:1406 length:219 start_codon:yes stop_codon:yes gene_type:complete
MTNLPNQAGNLRIYKLTYRNMKIAQLAYEDASKTHEEEHTRIIKENLRPIGNNIIVEIEESVDRELGITQNE